jgi:hypothetical protein
MPHQRNGPTSPIGRFTAAARTTNAISESVSGDRDSAPRVGGDQRALPRPCDRIKYCLKNSAYAIATTTNFCSSQPRAMGGIPVSISSLRMTKVRTRMEASSPAPVGRRRGRPGYLSGVNIPPAPKPRRVTSALDCALDLLFPWPADAYPGLWHGAAKFFQCSAWTVRDWRTGKRAAPQWVLDTLSTTLRKRAAEMISAAEAIEKERGRG